MVSRADMYDHSSAPETELTTRMGTVMPNAGLERRPLSGPLVPVTTSTRAVVGCGIDVEVVRTYCARTTPGLFTREVMSKLAWLKPYSRFDTDEVKARSGAVIVIAMSG